MMAFACCFEHDDPRKSVDIVAKNGVLPFATCGYVAKGTRMLKPKWSRHASTVSCPTFWPVRLLSGLIINSGESGGACMGDLATTGITVLELLRPCRDGRPDPRFVRELLAESWPRWERTLAWSWQRPSRLSGGIDIRPFNQPINLN
jgi:hypothetical protein